MDFLKGMGAGLLLGACFGMAVLPGKKLRPRKRRLCRAVRAMGRMVDELGGALGM